MFQFPGFASCTYVFSAGYPQAGGFPHSEIPGSKPVCRLTRAYRRLPRPSSPLIAKASTMCAFVLDHITPKSLLSLSFCLIASLSRLIRSIVYAHSLIRWTPRSQTKILRLNLFVFLSDCFVVPPHSFDYIHVYAHSLIRWTPRSQTKILRLNLIRLFV